MSLYPFQGECDSMCTHTETEMSKLSYPTGKLKRHTPVAQPFSSSLLQEGRVQGFTTSASHLPGCTSASQEMPEPSPSGCPGLAQVQEEGTIWQVRAELWAWGTKRAPSVSSLLQGTASQPTSGANWGRSTCSRYAQDTRTQKLCAESSSTHAWSQTSSSGPGFQWGV